MHGDAGGARLGELWRSLYGAETAVLGELHELLSAARRQVRPGQLQSFDANGLVYACYPDAFGEGLDGVRRELARLKSLGITILWLLPVLDSPGRDQGFDISDYYRVDARFGGNDALARLVAEARIHDIRLIFDIAINHTSDQHPWFRSAVAELGSPWRDFYHFSPDNREYADLPIIFPDMVDSVWSPVPGGTGYYLHRFYPFQPDLNYANPRVVLEMVKVLVHWRLFGIDGFRMDAAALLWKQPGTSCDSLPQTHAILGLFRAALDQLAPDSFLLAEANMPVPEMMRYFGGGDECRAAYQFQLMPSLWQALAEEDPQRLLGADIPELPPGCAWFTFLRCHDEVTLDTLPAAERPAVIAALDGGGLRSFRSGQAFSGRLFDLLGRQPERTAMALSLLFALPGTPVIYYGDEVAMVDNPDFLDRKAEETGYHDSRFLHRGPFDPARAALADSDSHSAPGVVNLALKSLGSLKHREAELFGVRPQLWREGTVLVSRRTLGQRQLLIRCNLAGQESGDLPAYGVSVTCR